jgi:hypothetical protein
LKRSFLAASVILVALLAGCDNQSLMGCTSTTNGCDAASSTQAPSPAVPVIKQLEQELTAAGFTKESEAGWRKGNDTVHLMPNLSDSYITVEFTGKGTVRCESIYTAPTQPDPVRRVDEIKKITYELATAGDCKPIKEPQL